MNDLFAPDSGWGNYALKGFNEIQVPEPVSLWPQTFGWWLLVIALICWLLALLFKQAQRYRRNRYRRQALLQLTALRTTAAQNSNEGLRQIPAILKATALHAFPRVDVASLYGDEWEVFLDSKYDGPSFSRECPGLLYALSYQPVDAQLCCPSDAFWAQVSSWISHHRAADD